MMGRRCASGARGEGKFGGTLNRAGGTSFKSMTQLKKHQFINQTKAKIRKNKEHFVMYHLNEPLLNVFYKMTFVIKVSLLRKKNVKLMGKIKVLNILGVLNCQRRLLLSLKTVHLVQIK